MKQIITPLGSLALKPGTTIDISKNNPMFTRAEEFSINLSVPRKPNESIFGYRYRLAASGVIAPVDARFVYNGREKSGGSIEVVHADDDAYDVLIKGGRNGFMFKYGKELLSELPFVWENFVPGVASPTVTQVQDEMFATLGLERDWICFPVRYSDFDVERWLNEWSFDLHSFRDSDANPYRTPFLRMWRALERIFGLKGYTVTENWFSGTSEKKQIVLFNNLRDLGSQVNIRYLLPAWTLLDFLNELEDYFPVTFMINDLAKTVQIISDDGVVTSAAVGNLDGYLERNYKIIFNEKKSGYKLSYTLPDDDSVKGDHEFIGDAWSTDINTPRDLPIPVGMLDGIEYYVLSEGRFYKTEKNGDVVQWVPKGGKALSVKEGKGEITRETKIYPLLSRTAIQQNTVTVTREYYADQRVPIDFEMVVPHTMKKPSLWTEDVRPMIYRGMDMAYVAAGEVPTDYVLDTYHQVYPMANYVNRKADGSRWADQVLELVWDGAMGLRGAETIAFREGADTINAVLVINHYDLEQIDTTKVYMIGGRRVLISEMVIHYAGGDNVKVDVVLMAEKNL